MCSILSQGVVSSCRFSDTRFKAPFSVAENKAPRTTTARGRNLAEFGRVPAQNGFSLRTRCRNPIMIRFSKCLNLLIDGAEFLNDRHRPKALPLDSKCRGRD